MVKVMYDLDGKKIEIVKDEEVENNLMDDLEDTIDLSKVVEVVKDEC